MSSSREIGFCSQCQHYAYVVPPEYDQTCPGCGHVVKILKTCPACQNWYLVDTRGAANCEACQAPLVTPTDEQLEAAEIALDQILLPRVGEEPAPPAGKPDATAPLPAPPPEPPRPEIPALEPPLPETSPAEPSPPETAPPEPRAPETLPAETPPRETPPRETPASQTPPAETPPVKPPAWGFAGEGVTCLNCGTPHPTRTLDAQCPECGNPVGHVPKPYRILLARLGLTKHPWLILVYIAFPVGLLIYVNYLSLAHYAGSPETSQQFVEQVIHLSMVFVINAVAALLTYLTASIYREAMDIYNPNTQVENARSGRLTRAFVNDAEAVDFKIKARKRLLSRKEWLYVLLFGGVFGAVGFATPPASEVVQVQGVLASQLTYYVVGTAWAFYGLLLGSVLHFIVGVVQVMLLIAREREDFAIFHFAAEFATREAADYLGMFREKPIIFSEFEAVTTMVGKFLYKICLRLLMVGIGISVLLMGIWSFFGIDVAITMAVSMAILVVVLGLFLVPQFAVHRLLADIKEKLVFAYKRIYDHAVLVYLTGVRESEPFQPVGCWETKKDMRADIQLLKTIYEDVESFSTWTFNFPAVFKLLGAGLAPVIVGVLQTFLAF